MTLDILYRDEWLVAVHKPSGLLVHRSPIAPESENFALQIVRDQIGQWVYPLHRLDRPTSGVLLFALDSETARLGGALFTERQVEKRYLAVVRGYTLEEETIDYPLREEPHLPEQQAVTRYRRLATVELPIPIGRYPSARYSLVEVWPETGRFRQIRKHFHHIFHPLIGDISHGEGRHNRLFREHFDSHRLLLYATDLHLSHPRSGNPLQLHAPLDANTQNLFAALGWQAWC